MNTIIYPKNFACPNRNGAAEIILPQQKNNLLHLHLKILALFIAALLFVASSAIGQGPCPTSNCTSGDIRITKVELVDAVTEGPLPSVCQPGQGLCFGKIKSNLYSNCCDSLRFFNYRRFFYQLMANPSNQNMAMLPRRFSTKTTHTRILNQVINWPCGSTITLSNVYTAWQHQAPSSTICTYLTADGSISNCSAIDPKCKFYAGQSFVVAAPLVANFTYTGSCPGNTLYQPITFSSPATGTGATTGGNKPYQYSWQITDAVTNLVVATSTTNPYTYTPTTNPI